MPEYRRSKQAGGTYFFTVVTYGRQPIFSSDQARELLHLVWNNVSERLPFSTDAVCLLSDHIHCIWTLPEDDPNFSLRWGEIKKMFSKAYIKEIGPGEARNDSRLRRGEAAIWQRRFWEHTIRDSEDYRRHVEYIHYNPVKHELVKKVDDWPWSSFHRYVQMGYYDRDWGSEISGQFLSMVCGE